MLARSSNAFGLDLYARLAAEPGNIALSPVSISTALAMAWAGAGGETAAQMRKALHLDGSAADAMTASGRLAASLQDPARAVTLRIANRLFGEKSYPFEKAYLDATEAAYGASLESLDFRHHSEKARFRINGWVNDQTEKRIQNLLPPGGVDSETRLVLVNAIYFLGHWADPFAPESTRDAPFYVTRNAPKNVPTMTKAGDFRLAEDNEARALELAYKGRQTSMLIVVSKDVDGLTKLERRLDTKRLDSLVASLELANLLVSVPKLELSMPEPLFLGRELAGLGMTDAFDRDRADFRAMANPENPADRLFMSNVFHKAFVKVDEKGTEAAAATATIMVGSAFAPARPTELKVDHPFLFFIRDNATGLILFMGRVVDPK